MWYNILSNFYLKIIIDLPFIEIEFHMLYLTPWKLFNYKISLHTSILQLTSSLDFFTQPYKRSKQVLFGGSRIDGHNNTGGAPKYYFTNTITILSLLLQCQMSMVNFAFILTKSVINLQIILQSNLYFHHGFTVSCICEPKR